MRFVIKILPNQKRIYQKNVLEHEKGLFFNLLGIKYVINLYHTGIVDLSLHATGLLVIYG